MSPIDSIPTFLLKLCFYELGPIITNLNLSIALFLEEFFHRHSNKLFPTFPQKISLSTDISTTFVWIQTPTSFPKFSKTMLPPAFNLTCLLTSCLLLRWRNPAQCVSFKFHFNEFCSLSRIITTFTDILSWMNLNKLLFSHQKMNFFSLIKIITSQVSWSNKLFSQHLYHPSQLNWLGWYTCWVRSLTQFFCSHS